MTVKIKTSDGISPFFDFDFDCYFDFDLISYGTNSDNSKYKLKKMVKIYASKRSIYPDYRPLLKYVSRTLL